MEYHITRFASKDGAITWPATAIPVLGKHVLIRKRRDAAFHMFNAAVDEMVRDHAALDTLHGTTAQRAARRAIVPGLRDAAVKIEHCGEVVMMEAVS